MLNRLLWLLLIVTRLRDRLRCPNCEAVGTYKLHAPPPTWRWLCKYCGYYRDKDGIRWCVPSPTYGCWIFADQVDGFKGTTPQQAVKEKAKDDRQAALLEDPESKEGYAVWPWRG